MTRRRYKIHQITHLAPEILTLEKEAVEECFRFITRLIEEWHSATSRFDAPREFLMVVCLNQQPIGVGDLSIDPYGRPIKVLVNDGIGFWLAARRLNQGEFHWAGVRQGGEVQLDMRVACT